ncbi:MAG: A24 family peptidase [Candidatus Woesearchaeota archaeon]
MIEVIYGICIFLLAIGTFTDLKVREVPDWLNYSGIAAGLGLRLIWSLYSFDWSYIIEGFVGFGVFLAIAFAMFYLGQWGGGDSKILMALGALLGLKFDLGHIAVSFLVWAVVVGGAYGLVWSVGLALRHWKDFKKTYLQLRLERKYARAKLFIAGFAIVALIASFLISEVYFKLLLVTIAMLVFLMFHMLLFIKSVEQCCMYKLVAPRELTEGDWIAKDIKIKGKRICGPKDLGIEKKQINELIKMKVKKVLIKVGIPFVPSFLIAFILAWIFGNPLGWFI